MKKIILLSIICYSIFTSLPAFALEITSVSLTDQRGTMRTNFSDSEKVNLNVSINNTAVIDRINFIFEIYDPSGNKKFTHAGNSIPGTLGSGGSSVRFIPISNFFSSNGTYKLVVFANTVIKETSFTIYAPNLTLTYPSNYTRDLTDKPLVFRWVSSGAPKYRIYVDDDAAFFNCLFKDDTIQTQYAYPAEPSDTRQKLSAGTIYYWKVEALDESGSTIIKTPVPYNFTIKSSVIAVTSKDIAITDISVLNNMVVVSCKNLGGKSESSVPLTLYLNGVLQRTINIDNIMQNELKTVSFTPIIFGNVIAMATITFDDDNTKNNIYTKQLTISQGTTVTPSTPTVTEKAKILGSVYSQDKNKLTDASVSFDGPLKGSVYANTGGEYKIENLTIGDYKLKASCSGYLNAEQSVKIDTMKSYTNVDFYLNPAEKPAAVATKTGSLSGAITNGEGKAMDNTVEVILSKTNAKTSENEEFAKIKTNNQGQFKFENVPLGEYVLSASKQGFETAEVSQVIIKEGKTETIDLMLVANAPGEETVDYVTDVKKSWDKIKTFISDEKILSQLNGYEIKKIDTKLDLNKVIPALENKKAKITGTEIIIE